MASASLDLLPNEVAGALAETLDPAARLWLVGGAVRDHFLEIETHDFDFAYDGDATLLARAVADRLAADYFTLDDARDTGRVLARRVGAWSTLDFAGLRGGSIESDLLARDFSVNALAISIKDHELLDPLGGLQHLRQHLLLPAQADSFQRDPIRILRSVRLAATLGFKFAPGMPDQLRQALPGLDQISGERLRDELFRLLQLPDCAGPMRVLSQLGVLRRALRAERELPEGGLATLDQLNRILEVLGRAHDPDRDGDLVIAQLSLKLGRFRQPLSAHLAQPLAGDRNRRNLALLLALTAGWGSEMPGQVRQISEALRFSRAEVDVADRIAAGVGEAATPSVLENAQPGQIYQYFRHYGAAGVEIILIGLSRLLASEAGPPDGPAWGGALDLARSYFEAYFEQPDRIHPVPLLRGDEVADLLGIAPGPRVGQALEAMLMGQATGEIDNRQSAVEFIRNWFESATR